MTKLATQLIGTWRLVSREDRSAAGERRIDPGLGADPVAMLVYDAAGNFAAQFMKRDRSSYEVTATARAGLNNSAAVGGYDLVSHADAGWRAVTRRCREDSDARDARRWRHPHDRAGDHGP